MQKKISILYATQGSRISPTITVKNISKFKRLRQGGFNNISDVEG